MSDDDDNAFLEAMSDVTPLKRDARVARPGAADRHRDSSAAIRREAAVTDQHVNAIGKNLMCRFDLPDIKGGLQELAP